MNPFNNEIGNPNDPNNQLLLQSLAQVNETNMLFFLMQNPDFVEDSDASNFKKQGISFLRNTFGVILLGTVLNLQLKRIPQFLTWNALLRIPLRIPVFLSPALLLKSQFESNILQIEQMHFKYYRRIINVKRTGDLRYFDPQGLLQKQFEKKMKSLQ